MARNLNGKQLQSYEILSQDIMPFTGIPDLISITDDRNCLRILFIDNNNNEIILTILNVICSKRTEERFMLSPIEEMSIAKVLGNFAILVGQSNFVQLLIDESLNTIDDMDLIHIRLMFNQDILDILIAGSIDISLDCEDTYL